MRVQVYFNLHKHLYSIVALDGFDKGQVIAHAEGVMVRDPEFVVQPAGRERVLREDRKNVHAFVRGEWVAVKWKDGPAQSYVDDETGETIAPTWPEDDYDSGIHVSYNPRRAPYFAVKGGGMDGMPVSGACDVTLDCVRGAGGGRKPRMRSTGVTPHGGHLAEWARG